jgi:hypothetical protein
MYRGQSTYHGTSFVLLFIILTASGRSSTMRESLTLYIKAGDCILKTGR